MRNVTIWSDDSNAARAIFRKQRTGEVSVDYGVHLGRPRWKGKPDDRAARRAETAERKPRHRDRAVDRGRTQRAGNSGRPCGPCGAAPRQIGRAHVCTPVTNAHHVCRLLLEQKNTKATALPNMR